MPLGPEKHQQTVFPSLLPPPPLASLFQLRAVPQYAPDGVNMFGTMFADVRSDLFAYDYVAMRADADPFRRELLAYVMAPARMLNLEALGLMN